jgi:hypothetical protein
MWSIFLNLDNPEILNAKRQRDKGRKEKRRFIFFSLCSFASLRLCVKSSCFVTIQVIVISTSETRRNLRCAKDFSRWSK